MRAPEKKDAARPNLSKTSQPRRRCHRPSPTSSVTRSLSHCCEILNHMLTEALISPTSVKTFLFATLAIPFTPLFQCLSDETVKHVGPFYLVSMPARGSKRSHQSALECVTVVDSTPHSKSKPPRSASMKKLPCTDKGRRRSYLSSQDQSLTKQ